MIPSRNRTEEKQQLLSPPLRRLLISKGGCIDGQNTPNRYRVIGGERSSPHGPTEGHSGVTIGQGVRDDRESPRRDSDDTDGVTRVGLTIKAATTRARGAGPGNRLLR